MFLSFIVVFFIKDIIILDIDRRQRRKSFKLLNLALCNVFTFNLTVVDIKIPFHLSYIKSMLKERMLQMADIN